MLTEGDWGGAPPRRAGGCLEEAACVLEAVQKALGGGSVLDAGGGAGQGHEGIPRLAFHRVLCDSGHGHPSRKRLSVFTPVSGTQGDREATRTRREESTGRAVAAALTPGLELGAESAPPCGRLPGWQAW